MSNLRDEYLKCYRDKTRKYFIEQYLSTYDASRRKSVPFHLFPRQIELVNGFCKYDNIITVKPRQSGVTTVTSAFITAQLVFASPQAPETVLCIGNKLDISQQLVTNIGNFLEQVPRWMWGGDYYSPDPKSEKNTVSIFKKRNKQYLELFNGCKVYARSSGKNAARGIAAASYIVFDEAAFIENGPDVYSQAVATTNSVSHAKVIMISTPNGKDQLYYQTYAKAVRKENNFHIISFKWFQDPRYNQNLSWTKKDAETGETETIYDPVIDKSGNIPYDEERWSKLEKDGWKPSSPWYRKTCQTMNNDSIRINQELNVSFLGSSDNVVPVEVIEMQSTRNVIEITEDWPLRDMLVEETWIWKDPMPGHRYICSCDPSSGAGEDYSAIQVIDVDAEDENGVPCFEQVLEYNGKLNGSETGQILDRYGRIYNDALIVVDSCGGYGDAVCLTLLDLGYPNLYYDDPSLKNYTNENLTTTKTMGKESEKQLPGFRTSSLRLRMISNFVELVKNNTLKIRSMRTINELDTWVFKNGRPDHMDGSHDDLLTCLSMGLFVMQFYMLRRDKLKTKDVKMVNSWVVNNINNQNTYPTPQNSNGVIDVAASKKFNLPFYSSRKSVRDERRLMAMMMLGCVGKGKKSVRK